MFNYHAWVYANLVIKGKMKFEDLPKLVKDDVKEYLTNKGYEHLCR